MTEVVLVDSSAWIEYLRATGSAVDAAVQAAMEANNAATTDVILFELLCGTTSEERADDLRDLLNACHQLSPSPRDDAEAASALYRTCRRAGQTPRVLLDCLIAAVAVRHDVAILHRDRDFDVIARHTDLRIAPGSAT